MYRCHRQTGAVYIELAECYYNQWMRLKSVSDTDFIVHVLRIENS